VLIPHLFEQTDPGFSTRCQAGDIIVTGRNFGMGQKATGYIAMQALGLGLLCETMSHQAHRAAVGEGLRVLPQCPDLLTLCDNGDQLEVNFGTGLFVNRSRGVTHTFSPCPEALRDLVKQGGTAGWLSHWRQSQPT
jgi:3-isopropylmalate/(R)-2-methylmalate dehydratase small subunit